MNMKRLYFLTFSSLILSLVGVSRHIKDNNACNHNNNEEIVAITKKEVAKSNLYPSILELDKTEKDYICFQGYNVDKIFIYFTHIYPLSCSEFFFFIFNKYAKESKRSELLAKFYSFTPDQLWSLLNDENYFSSSFIEMINALYERDYFILICKTRMSIEFLIFAFNIKEKTTEYQYSYFKDINLKDILYVLFDFVEVQSHLLAEQVTSTQISDFKKFLDKYIKQRNISKLQFVTELKSFKYFFTAFFGEKGNQKSLSPFELMDMYNRFSKIVKV